VAVIDARAAADAATEVTGPSRAALANELRAALGEDRVRTGPTELGVYRRDGSELRGAASIVCFPRSTDEVQCCVQAARRHGVPFVARGSGTGLSGGAVPLHGALVIVTTKMDEILSVDLDARLAWVEPGVLNADLSRRLAAHGVHYAPDPSSQQSCSIGGNVATNAGGPHCLAYGVTAMHVLAVEVVLPDGSVAVLGGEDPEPVGLDLRGAFVGGEGMLGIATRICVRLTQDPPEVRTMVLDFERVEDGAATVSAVSAAGVLPAALEMMDARITQAVEAYVHAGFPSDAEAILIVELDGLHHAVEASAATVAAIGRARGARHVRVAADETERALIWKGRKSAFGALARIKPNYYLHDTVVPRRALVEVLAQVYEIAARHELIVMNVFHAGDGNLHPLLVFDRREVGVMERVHAAGDEIVRASVAAGGVLSGEHGIGLEKRDLMPLLFSADDLDAQARLREAFDVDGLANPEKVLPAGSRCGDLQHAPAGAWI
jgi:glycolate oxidase